MSCEYALTPTDCNLSIQCNEDEVNVIKEKPFNVQRKGPGLKNYFIFTERGAGLDFYFDLNFYFFVVPTDSNLFIQ